MQTLAISSSSSLLYKKICSVVKASKCYHQNMPFCSVSQNTPHFQPLHKQHLTSLTYNNPLSVLTMKRVRGSCFGGGTVCCSVSSSSTPTSSTPLQWLTNTTSWFITATTLRRMHLLMLGHMIGKEPATFNLLLAPFFLLEAPPLVVSFIKGGIGLWTAFLFLLVRLFVHIPVAFELPFIAMLLVIVCPEEIMSLKDTPRANFLGLVIAIYMFLCTLGWL